MSKNLSYRKATKEDLRDIIGLLIEDDLGKTREMLGDEVDASYLKAFELIDKDPNQYLMLCIMQDAIVATCHLTIMPSLTFKGSTRMQIEGVRVSEKMRGQNIGEYMIVHAIEYGKSHGATMIQLMTNKQRPRAKHFYEKVGFEATHEGMKLLL
jgi:ribosomal protein S18 acetylase RimI-like enzyme